MNVKTVSGTTVTVAMETDKDPHTQVIQFGKTLHNANSYYSQLAQCSYFGWNKFFFLRDSPYQGRDRDTSNWQPWEPRHHSP